MNEILEQALRYEEDGKFKECEQLYLKALDEYPKDKDVLTYVAIFLFKKEKYNEALDLFVKSYNHPNQSESTKEDLLNHILVAYYHPNEEIIKKTYINNVSALMAYEHNHISAFRDFEELPYLCIPRSDLEYYIWDKRTKTFNELLVMDKVMTSYQVDINDCVLGVNIFDIVQLQSLTEQTRDLAWIDNIKVPVYVVWQDHDKIQKYLQLANYKTIIDLKRVVFFSSYKEKSKFDTFFYDHQAIFPNKLVGDQQHFQEIIKILNQLANMRAQDIDKKKISINQMAQKYDKKYYKNLFSSSVNNIRILFYTCRFTTVLQYANRDFMQACKKIGIQCEVVIEKSDIHRASPDTELVNKIAEFKPNIIFLIHYFKSDFKAIPSNIMSISWLQDPNPKFASREHAKQFSWNDFALVLTPDWCKQMIQTGYDKSRLSIQAVPVSEAVFYAKNMSPEEVDFYTADIAFAGNYYRPEEKLAEMISKYTTGITDFHEKSRLTNLLISTYDELQTRIENDELIVSKEMCETIINEMKNLLGVKIGIDVIKQISKEVFSPLCYCIHRKTTLKWLIAAGFQVKLWGGGWETDPCFKANAMGILAHGENLAKMYSCTKILPGAFSEYTEHFRLLESASCGALYMARYVPVEYDSLDIRKSFVENEDFLFYHSKQDLIDQVNYYLANEEERQQIVENCRKKVLQTHTYSSAVCKCLGLIQKNVTKK